MKEGELVDSMEITSSLICQHFLSEMLFLSNFFFDLAALEEQFSTLDPPLEMLLCESCKTVGNTLHSFEFAMDEMRPHKSSPVARSILGPIGAEWLSQSVAQELSTSTLVCD